MAIAGRAGVQDFSCFSVPVWLFTRMGKQVTEQTTQSGQRKGSGPMSSVWDISNLRHPGDLEERSR